MYRLYRDEDSHWYIIPVDITYEVYAWEEKMTEFWSGGWKEGMEEPDTPKGMIQLGCGFESVHFKEFEINC